MRSIRRFGVLAALPLLSGCGVGHQLFGGGTNASTSLGQLAPAPVAFGYVVADEPQAALIGRQILDSGGNAADAAAAIGFAMSVTLPSRAGLGGGGACIIKMPDAQGNPGPAVTLSFPPGAPASSSGSRPAAIPMLARGLLAMQARYGALASSSVVVPAERLAGGVQVSSALAADLQVVGHALLGDPSAAALFGDQSGNLLTAGANMIQPSLAATFEVLRVQSVQGLYAGSFADQFVQAADIAGGGLTDADMTGAVPIYGQPDIASSGTAQIATLPVASPSTQALPASAGFAALDKNGGAVACVTTMNNLFGTGRIASGTGILLAASPRVVPAPLLAAGMASSGGKFRAAVTGTGQQGAALAVTSALQAVLAKQPAQVADPGRANIISCPGLVPGGEASCTASADPRGQGLAIGGR